MSIYQTLDTIVSDIIRTARVAELKRNKELRRKEREAKKRGNPYRYYVYAFYREDGTPYYIGKGCGGRMHKKRGKGEVNPPVNKDRVKILENNLTEDDAYEREKYYISLYGRKDTGSGILRNKCEGGRGSEGNIGIKKLAEDGTLHLLGKVACITKQGCQIKISKDIYNNQIGDPSEWEYVLPHSFEGYVRKCRKKGDTSPIEYLYSTYGSHTCVNKEGKVVKITKQEFRDQIGTKSDKEYVTINSTEGRRRLGIKTRTDICVINKKGEKVFIEKEVYISQPRTYKLGVNLPSNEFVNPRSKEGQSRISLLEGISKNSCGMSGYTYIINTKGEIKNIAIEEYNRLKCTNDKEWVSIVSDEGKLRKSKMTGKPIKENCNKGKTPVINIHGQMKMMLCSEYYAQEGDLNNFEWCNLSSMEGIRRKSVILGKALKNPRLGNTIVINLYGETKSMKTTEYRLQTGDKNNWEWIAVQNPEGKRRKQINKK